MATAAVTHPRFAPRRTPTGGTWWSKAWGRAVEESSYAVAELRAGRAAARRGDVGGITISPGRAVAAVREGDDVHTASCTLPVLREADVATLVELVAAEAGRIGALMTGELPHSFVEAVEEAGVELLPFGGEIGAECTCDAWMDPCPHALAVLTQVGWLLGRDPFVLTALRGLPREELLARLHARDINGDDATGPDAGAALAEPELEEDLAVAEDAALRAERWLARVDEEGRPVTGS